MKKFVLFLIVASLGVVTVLAVSTAVAVPESTTITSWLAKDRSPFEVVLLVLAVLVLLINLVPLPFFGMSFFFTYMKWTRSWWEGGVVGALVAGIFGWLFYESVTTTLLWSLVGLMLFILIDYTSSPKRERSISFRKFCNKVVARIYSRGGGSSGSGSGGFGGGSSGGGGASGSW